MQYSNVPVILDRNVCRDFGRSSKLEWLQTDGSGGFAMGTVAGVNTRRYHGYLVASLEPPVGRFVALAKTDEEIDIGGSRYALGCNQFPGAIDPRGFELLDSFRLDPFPIWTWQLGSETLTKQLFFVKDKTTVVVQYTATAGCTLRVRPFLAFRDFHSLRREDATWRRAIDQHPDHFRIHPYPEGPALTFQHNAQGLQETSLWYRNFEYLIELERGMDFREDLYQPCELTYQLEAGAIAYMAATLGDDERGYDADAVHAAANEARSRQVSAGSPLEAKLAAASVQFRARRRDGRLTVMAGFPWFADWGRDTMVSLPGLFSTAGLLDEAQAVIESFITHLNQGLIPNNYPEHGAPEYNTCDATLWMFPAVWSYMQRGGSLAWVKHVFYPAVKEILGWHLRGTLYEIHCDPEDGLLSAGVEGMQLTWMDAKVGDWVVTPRHGKPVEINALWYNALRMSAHWAVECGDMDYAAQLTALADKTQAGFTAKFWNAERNCLYDVLQPQAPVAKLRPNQIFAVSLPFGLLDEKKQKAVVDIVERELLTPVGLRTLERSDPEYRPRYEGDRVSRDGAYHQGTVWPWLLGPFVSAYLKVNGNSEAAMEHCRALMNALEPETLACCLGSLCEIYDGDPPHRPRGCIAQAWSVAETLRVLRTDLS
jgi:predicted glycogen debranching enzyme